MLCTLAPFPPTEARRSQRSGDAAARRFIRRLQPTVQLLGNPPYQVGSILADTVEQGRASRPLPAPSDDVETRHGGDATLVHEHSIGILNLWDSHPSAVVLVPRRPYHRVHLGRLAAGEAEVFAIYVEQAAFHTHTLPLKSPKLQILARKRVGLHQVLPNRRLARRSKDSKLIHPPEDAPAQYPLGAHVPGS